MFNKYRRDPFSEDGPKYRYEKGATSVLYGVNFLPSYKAKYPVIICEGEFDTLLLISRGYSAVTSTGGSGTFKEEWIKYLKDFGIIYICYDYDDAGIKGAFNVSSMIPGSRLIWLPKKNHFPCQLC